MSADNWNVCPACVDRLKRSKDEFTKKYYGKIDSSLFIGVRDEFDRKIKHMEAYTSDEFKENEKIKDTVYEKKLTIDLGSGEQEVDDLIQGEETGTPLREDYEQGVGSDMLAYVIYSGTCHNCAATWQFKKQDIKEGG